ncbi:glutathione S-transferase family protein [Azospirillum sp. RWY-5-1]|uniref:Glutathione S-transferase family protein n=1 Tax=Azospirillum oleiclasticum TaxID=2735135 RepID=A0ABX2TGF3_9PROT|nr:glutathione S-transferase family protein [Azospirillum oleiclasticum]NYZ15063.1 glutathione S-transferase family protein [Azospirillum oleiclasticum]NYZ22825.1 glutathione S-transferase family protein [Azospirillum oleiclasticum]
MTIRLYDLAGADERCRFSPFCWRTRLALAHKGLEVETIPWRFTDKAKLPEPSNGRVPVIVDGDRVVHDSWAIAEYLEDQYPDSPSLFPAGAGRPVALFLNTWADTVLNPAVAKLVVSDITDRLHAADLTYFRMSREKRFGMPLEQVTAERDAALPGFRKLLEPLRQPLRRVPFLGGEAPAYADMIVFGAFQWARVVSPFELLAADDPVAAWRERMLDLHGGLARAVPGRG